MTKSLKKKGMLKVSIPENIKSGVYSNLVGVTTTANREVILDFVFSHPQDKKKGEKQGTLVSRVIVSEAVAKQLIPILNKQFGKSKEK